MSEYMKSDALSNAEVLDILKQKIGFVGQVFSDVEWRYELNKKGQLLINELTIPYDEELARKITIELATALYIPWEPLVNFKVVLSKTEYPRIEMTTLPVSLTGWAEIKAELTY